MLSGEIALKDNHYYYILIKKQENIGIRGIVLEWLQSCLRKRQQYVEFKN